MTGLTSEQVIESRQKHGSNTLTPPSKESLFLKFLQCFSDPIIRILLVALALSIGIAVYQYACTEASPSVFFEPLGILFAIILATLIGFILELKNEKTFQALNEVDDDTLVKVIRDGNVCQVPRRDIVVGDIIMLETGEEVPADAELLESFNLVVNESSLTGELKCDKFVDPNPDRPEATYPYNHIMKGCTVIDGYCTARVFAVGDATDCGKVFTAAQVAEGDPTPLSEKLDSLAHIITIVSYTLAALIIAGRLANFFLRNGSADWLEIVKYCLDTVMIAVTLIVVAVPEGLPMSVNLSLAFSMKKLMRDNTLPRTMHACETMGAITVICTDKTGTLTKNRMEVAEWSLLQDAEVRIHEAIACNTTANLDFSDNRVRTIGNPTEGALLLWLHNQNIQYVSLRQQHQLLDRLPFNTELKYMASVVRSSYDGRRILYVKGAPEIILTMCPVSDTELHDISAALSAFQSRAMRTISVAYKVLADDEAAFCDGRVAPTDLTFLGTFAISDPVRDEVPGAMRQCREAGIDVKIVTGDVVGTAREIGRQCGVITDEDGDDAILTGNEFASLSDDDLKARLNSLKILSRARPADKQRLVRLLKSMDHVVAVTGDGTNDAPALNSADVGLSMGDGTAVAKEASDMTILDSSFGSITNSVLWGRSLYKNIQRFVMFQMTVNVAACLIVVIGAFVGTQSPLTVTQMLWVNLIMDTFAALALASLPPSHEVMYEQPRSVDASIISRPMARNILGFGILFTTILAALLVFFHHADVRSLTTLPTLHTGSELSPYELSLFFTLFVLFQFWNIFNAKAFMTGHSAFHSLRNCNGFIAIAAVILLGQIIIVSLGGRMFSVVPLSLLDWLVLLVITSPILIIPDLVRQHRHHREIKQNRLDKNV